MSLAGLPILVALAATPAQTMITIAPPAPPAPPAQPSVPIQFPVEVEVRAGAERLFAGTLEVGSPVTSTFRQERVDAVVPTCGASDSYPVITMGGRAVPRASSFTISISTNYQRTDGRVQLNVRWVRPGSSSCTGQFNTRTVEMNESVLLAPGQTVTVQGDAGLVVRLTRR